MSMCMLYTDDLFATHLPVIHLQWFAAEDEGRTEEPSEHKIRKAREDGKVAKSQDMNGAIVLLFTVVGLAILARYLLRGMIEMLVYYMDNLNTIDITTDNRTALQIYRYFIRLALPIGLIGFVAAFLANFVQVGALFTLKPITPDFNRILPRVGQFFKRSFASVDAGFNLLKSTGKLVIIIILSYINVQLRIGMILNMVHAPLGQSALLIARLIFSILLQTAIILVMLSFFDYLFQRWRHRESLKMTRQELREERKTHEGDPLVKSRLRRRMQELLSSTMVRNVPNADVVITNPTHYAIALEYKSESMSAPTIIAKGQDEMAQRIRKIAEEHLVPLVENRPLARALHAEVEIGDTIPQKFYEAVVAILAQVYRMRSSAGVS